MLSHAFRLHICCFPVPGHLATLFSSITIGLRQCHAQHPGSPQCHLLAWALQQPGVPLSLRGKELLGVYLQPSLISTGDWFQEPVDTKIHGCSPYLALRIRAPHLWR